MIFLTALIFILILSLLLLRKRIYMQKWNLPHGPSGLPIVGSFFSLLTSTPPHVKFSEWASTYGGLYTVNILTKKLVVVSCPKLMRQIFEHPASSGKFDLLPILLLSGGHYGVTSTEGKVWSEQRKFCVRTLRQFGMGKRNEIQSTILSEANQAINMIREEAQLNNGVIDSPIELLKTLISNTLWKIVRGDGFSVDDKLVQKITGDFSDAINNSIKHGLAMFPWLRWIAPKWSGYKDLVDSSKKLRNFIGEQFEEHKKRRVRFEDGTLEEPHDMLDVYADQMEKANKLEDVNSTFYGENGWKNSVAIVAEMFAGGGESTPHSLNWLILYLIHNQNVQKKLHEEIDKVLGKEEPSLMDKSRMPYTEAVILEILRISPAFPLTTAHKLTEDVDLCGFKMPRDLLLISNIHQAHMNQEFWGDAEAFRPERFLPEEDKKDDEAVSERKASVVAFNVGKRACLGEPLAMDVLFLFVVKLFQAFHFSPFPENVKPDYESSEPFLIIAKPYSIVVKNRK